MQNVVVLVPGFFGFARFGGFYYFADRLISMLRGGLQQVEGGADGAVPVVPVTTLPTDSLRNRQASLLEQLSTVARRLYPLACIHLIGHSTGGVDAQLVACTRNIDGKPWDPKWHDVRRMIRSVVTISAPHYGTELADSRFALVGQNPLANPSALLAELGTLRDFLRLVPRYLAANAGFEVSVPNDVLKFAWQVIQNRDLIHDLQPKHMEELRRRLQPEEHIKLKCFVTGTMLRTDKARPSDPLFADLYALTEGKEHVSNAVGSCMRFLQKQVTDKPGLVIRSADGELPVISPTLNDGIVNSVRQIVRPNADEFGGFIVADHADVLGHYDHQDALVGGRPLNAGLFHSGAGFGDTEFFKLYRTVAEIILNVRTEARAEQRSFNAVKKERAVLKALKREGATIKALKREGTALKNAKNERARRAKITLEKTALKKSQKQLQHVVHAADRFRGNGRSAGGRRPSRESSERAST